MTREKAKQIISDIDKAYRNFTADEYKALEMAIQALSQEPCTDAVSRQAVIYYIKGHIHEIITESGTDKNAHTNSILRALINGVETMPSVTEKSGKWENLYRCWMCSECGKQTHIEHNYCPNCGARMESAE